MPAAISISRSYVNNVLSGLAGRLSLTNSKEAEMAIRVECINKTDRDDPHERIRSIGGRNPDGERWKLSQEKAIAGIQSGEWDFYVERPSGDRVKVIVAESRYGNLYLKTEADGDQPNNLLSLPECP